MSNLGHLLCVPRRFSVWPHFVLDNLMMTLPNPTLSRDRCVLIAAKWVSTVHFEGGGFQVRRWGSHCSQACVFVPIFCALFTRGNRTPGSRCNAAVASP